MLTAIASVSYHPDVQSHVVCSVGELPPGTQRGVIVGGRPIAIFNVDGLLFAIRDRCPHQGAALLRGTVVGAVRASAPGCYEYDASRPMVRCPWHGWEFELSSGQSWFDPRRERVKAYEVTVETGAKLIEGPVPGPYVAETVPLSVEDDYIVVRM
jgi:3-phenylpropionate/trans-cinnamate dioxygenase ferredoxin subunit